MAVVGVRAGGWLVAAGAAVVADVKQWWCPGCGVVVEAALGGPAPICRHRVAATSKAAMTAHKPAKMEALPSWHPSAK